MTWLTLAVFGQFLTAVSVLVDRHIVVRAQHIGEPIVYAFYVSVLSGFVVVIIPFGLVSWPSAHVLILSLCYAGTFVSAIYLLYSALRVARASDAAPVIGAVSAITTLILAGLVIDGDVKTSFVAPVLLLAAGTALISHFHFSRLALFYALLAGALFGVTALLFKLVVMEVSFIDGFFWTRMMSVVAGLSLLVVPILRASIVKGGRRASPHSKFLVIGNKILGSVAGLLTAIAISIGSVAVVNALSGLQFVFLFIFALLFAGSMPLMRQGSKTHGHGGWQTGIGVSLIVCGLAALYLVTV